MQRLYGVRIKMSAYGYGKKPDPFKLILQACIGLTLLGFSYTFTDFLMLNVFEASTLEPHPNPESNPTGRTLRCITVTRSRNQRTLET